MKILKIILSFFLIVVVCVLCQWFVKYTNIKFPGSLLGMILLSILMYFKIINLEFIELSGNILLKHISLFFVPLLVGGFAYLFSMGKTIIPIFIVFLISSVLLILFTGLTVQYLLAIKIYKNRRLKK